MSYLRQKNRKLGSDILSIEIQTLPTPSALLDLIFLPWPGYEHVFVTATSTGTLTFYTLTAHAAPSLTYVHTHQCTDPSILLTDLEPHPSVPGVVGYVTSSGLASIIEFNLDTLATSSSSETEANSWQDFVKCHDSFPCADEGFEAWTLAFAPATVSSPEGGQRKVGVYTGSDDSTLRRLDFVLDEAKAFSTQPLTSGNTEESDNEDTNDDGTAELKILDRRSHNAGVVAILPLVPPTSHDESGEFILTGSYDDHIRLIYRPSTASMPQTRNQVLAETNLEGGVWRLRIIRHDRKARSWIVLASCMHAGSRVVRVVQSLDDGEWRIEVLVRFEEHKSMNYGSDVQPLLSSVAESGVDRKGDGDGGEREIRTVVSTSFYDRSMCLWRIHC